MNNIPTKFTLDSCLQLRVTDCSSRRPSLLKIYALNVLYISHLDTLSRNLQKKRRYFKHHESTAYINVRSQQAPT